MGTSRRLRWAAYSAVAASIVVPAMADGASAVLNYTCTTVVGDQPFTVIADSDAPATAVAGTPIPVRTTADVSVPASIADLIRTFLGGDSVDGVATVSATAEGVQASIPMTVPRTKMPASGPVVISAAANAASTLTPSAPGIYRIVAGDFTSTLTFYKVDGTVSFGPTEVPCKLDPGQDATVDTIAVSSPPPPAPAAAVPTTTVLGLTPLRVAYGQTVSAVATVRAANGAAAAGTVAFGVGGTSTPGTLVEGVARANLTGLVAGMNTVTAAVSPAPGFGASTASATVKVTKAPVVVRMRATRGGSGLVEAVKVTGRFGTVPTGRVTVTISKGSDVVGRAVVRLSRKGRATARFADVPDGPLRVKVVFRGDANHLTGAGRGIVR